MFGALRLVARKPNLGRLVLTWGIGQLANWGWLVVLAAIAFENIGASAVGILFAVRQLAGIAVAPWLVRASRGRAGSALRVNFAVNAVAVVAGGTLALVGAPLALVCVAVAVDGICSLHLGPVQRSWMPWLTDTPQELAGANGATELLGAAGLFVGPGLAAILLALVPPAVVFAVLAGAYLTSAFVVPGSASDGATATTTEADAEQPANSEELAVRRLFVGLCVLATVGTCFIGVVNAFAPAVAIERLGMGQSGPAVLIAAVGLGGMVAGLVSIPLLSRVSLVVVLGAGFFGQAAAAVVAAWSIRTGVVLSVMCAGGIALVLVAVTSTAAVQRLGADARMHARMTILDTSRSIGLAAGGLLASGLLAGFGVSGGLRLVGLAVAVVFVAVLPLLRGLTAQVRRLDGQLAVLAEVDLFRPLSLVARSRVAEGMRERVVGAGDVLVRQGDPGDCFFVIASGTFDAVVDGVPVRSMGTGDGFGEIALLHDVPRTATVTAVEPGRVWEVPRSDFLAAVTGSEDFAAGAHSIAEVRLGSDRTMA